MNEYVLGFCFNKDMNEVLLIKKNYPDWQKGKLNGLGGKVELGESHHEAMVREFHEECGLNVDEWTYYTSMQFDKTNDIPADIVYCFYSTADIRKAESKTDEILFIGLPDYLPRNIIPNLQWLIGLARDIDSLAKDRLPMRVEVTAGY